jgi:hypothetical protein
MKKLSYIDSFFAEDLYKKFTTSSLNSQYYNTNSSKRSFSTKDLRDIDFNLYEVFIDCVKKNFDIEIIDCELKFYKRKNTVFNPHVDGFPLQILVYLQGEKCNFENGTFFMNKKNDTISVQISNFENTAIIFDGNFIHGSVQGKYNESEIGFRYSLNCFIKDYKYSKKYNGNIA